MKVADSLSTGSGISIHGHHDLPTTCHILVTAVLHLMCREWYRFCTYFISSLRSIKYASGPRIRLEWWTCTVNINRSAFWNRLSTVVCTSLAVRSGRAIIASCTSSQFYTVSCLITSKAFTQLVDCWFIKFFNWR